MMSRMKNSAGPTSDGRLDEDFGPRLARRRALQMLVGVLDHHDGGVDHGADGDGDAAQAHDVGADAQRAHGDEGHQDADRQHEDGHQRAAHVQQEHDADQRDDDAFLEQRALQRVDGALDQLASGRRPARCSTPSGRLGGELGDALLDVARSPRARSAPKRCRAMPETTSPSPLSSVMPRRSSGPSSTRATSREQHRRAAVALDDDLLDVVERS